MTVSTKSKGASKELLAKHELEHDGWRVIFKSCTVKRGNFFVGLDVADLFDLIAIHDDPPAWKFISVKNWADGRKHPQHRDEIFAFKVKYGLVGMAFELWLWFPSRYRGRGKNKHWEIARWEKTIC